MTFSRCGSYHKDTYDYDEFILSIQYVFDSLEGEMIKFRY